MQVLLFIHPVSTRAARRFWDEFYFFIVANSFSVDPGPVREDSACQIHNFRIVHLLLDPVVTTSIKVVKWLVDATSF